MSYSSKTLTKSLQVPAANEKRLSICLTTNGFSFSEVSADGRLTAFGEAEGEHAPSMTAVVAELKAYLGSAGIRPLGYKSMELVAPSNESVWVPDELLLAGHNRAYLDAVGGEAATVISAHCAPIASTAVFAANDTLTTAFKVAMPGLVVKNQHVKLAESGLRALSAKHPLLLLGWRGTHIDLSVMRGGKYLFGNTLPFGTVADALFKTIEVMKATGVEGQPVELLMYGEADRERFSAFRPYFPQATLFTGLADTSASVFKPLHTYRHALILL